MTEDDRYMVILQGRQCLSLTMEVKIKGYWELKEGRIQNHLREGSESNQEGLMSEIAFEPGLEEW